MTQNANISIFIFFCDFVKKSSIEIFAGFFSSFCVIISVPIQIWTQTAPQDDCLNLSFVKDEHIFMSNPLDKLKPNT
jgi:hypothetical protein